MIHQSPDRKNPKSWFSGPWNSKLPIPVGYANEGINEKHYHTEMYEIYLVAIGSSVIEINNKKINLKAGDMITIEPGETHTFLESSKDYYHFVIHTPFVKNDKIVVSN